MEVRFTRAFGIYGGTPTPASVHHGSAVVNVERGGSGFVPVKAMSLTQSPLAKAFAEIVVSSYGAKFSSKIVRVVGLAASVPFVESNPLDPANRRISIVVLNKESEEQLLDTQTAQVEDAESTTKAVDEALTPAAADAQQKSDSAQASVSESP